MTNRKDKVLVRKLFFGELIQRLLGLNSSHIVQRYQNAPKTIK